MFVRMFMRMFVRMPVRILLRMILQMPIRLLVRFPIFVTLFLDLPNSWWNGQFNPALLNLQYETLFTWGWYCLVIWVIVDLWSADSRDKITNANLPYSVAFQRSSLEHIIAITPTSRAAFQHCALHDFRLVRVVNFRKSLPPLHQSLVLELMFDGPQGIEDKFASLAEDEEKAEHACPSEQPPPKGYIENKREVKRQEQSRFDRECLKDHEQTEPHEWCKD